jgi:hypothetical protein
MTKTQQKDTSAKSFFTQSFHYPAMEKSSAKRILFLTSALALIISFFIAPTLLKRQSIAAAPDVFVGIDASFASVNETKQIVDMVKSYTNIFVVGSTAITWNLTSLTEVCQYLNDSGLHFMTFAHPAGDMYFSQTQWIKDARQFWNSSYLGLYAYDEPGGHQIDHDYMFMSAQEASNYSDAAATYVKNLTYYLDLVKTNWNIGIFPVFASDYALYEYDYRAGYNAVFTEFSSKDNNSQLSVALCRGAAIMHDSDWGVMITGNLTDTDLQTGQKMYDEMVLAYQNGAKYILVFDYPSFQGGILRQEHFEALKQFWQYTQSHPRTPTPLSERVAFVVPKDYGFGFRGPTDKIWGLWEADEQSTHIWNQAINLVQQYKGNLDIVYEDCSKVTLKGYSQLIYWNGTVFFR